MIPSKRYDRANPEEFGISSSRLERIQEWQENLVREERLPMTALTIVRDGKTVYECVTGFQNVESKTPASPDTIYRMYSMTKPIVSVAIMMLFEMGKLHISDPAHLYLGEKWKKRNMRVYVQNSYDAKTKHYETRACERTITIKHLLTHTSGITYGFDVNGLSNKVDKIFHDKLRSRKTNLKEFVENLLPTVPLMFQPGKHWWYGFNTDVLGRIVEVVSGTDLETFLRRFIFKPLGMTKTSFTIHHDPSHFASCYMRKGQEIGMLAMGKSKGNDRGLRNLDKLLNEKEHMCNPLNDPNAPNFFQSGGGGLCGTVQDYVRFCECIRNGGGIDGVRILSRKTVQFMLSNHLGPYDMRDMQRGVPIEGAYTEMGEPGTGFGLGFSVTVDETRSSYVISNGSVGWGGAASTVFWIDPKERLSVVFATQLRFRDDLKLPIRALLSNLIYASVIDGDAYYGRRSRM